MSVEEATEFLLENLKIGCDKNNEGFCQWLYYTAEQYSAGVYGNLEEVQEELDQLLAADKSMEQNI